MGYYADSDNWKLLAPDERAFQIKRGEGWLGQSNVWYADGPRHAQFRVRVRDYISGRLKLTQSHPKSAGKRPPRQVDAKKRAKIEATAIGLATRHFEQMKHTVVSVESKNLGWDLDARLGPVYLRVEVKGLSGRAISVQLTPQEYSMLQRHRDNYRLCVATGCLSPTPTLHVFAWSRLVRAWQDPRGLRLDMKEVVGAIARAR